MVSAPISTSSPEINIRKTNPNSARKSRIGLGATRLNPLVPMIIPARISPMTMGIRHPRSLLASKGTSAAKVVIRRRDNKGDCSGTASPYSFAMSTCLLYGDPFHACFRGVNQIGHNKGERI
jgi:hypothetical protein